MKILTLVTISLLLATAAGATRSVNPKFFKANVGPPGDTLLRTFSIEEKIQLICDVAKQKFVFNLEILPSGKMILKLIIKKEGQLKDSAFIDSYTGNLEMAITDFALFDSSTCFDQLLLDCGYRRKLNNNILWVQLKNSDAYRNALYQKGEEYLSLNDKASRLKKLIGWPCRDSVDVKEKKITYDIWVQKEEFISEKLKGLSKKYALLSYLWLLRDNEEKCGWLTGFRFHSENKVLQYWHTPASCGTLDYDNSMLSQLF